jgi:hypothetical protein
MRTDGRPEDAGAPILVLGSGQRCGSTLVQRLLTSHPRVLIWGEHGGHLSDFIAMQDVLGQWDANVGVHGRDAFAKGGFDSWIANMLPGADALAEAARAYLLALFADPAAALGRPRWGFKEVRFGFAEAEALRAVFPALTVVHVTRDPRDVLISLEAWETQRGWWTRDYTEIAVGLWTDITESFLGAGDQPWVVSRRYEDVIADPARFVGDVARLLGAAPDDFDASIFDRRIHGYDDSKRVLKTWDTLPRAVRALLGTDRARKVAADAGYDVPDARPRRWSTRAGG